MSITIEAPDERMPSGESVFLAGGITDCRDWQQEVVRELTDTDLVIFNPRRSVWPSDPREVKQQIEWERKRLDAATLISFWFASETVCPITLLELGYALGKSSGAVVGCHPEYSRRQDVEIQLNLTHPDSLMATSPTELSRMIRQYFGCEGQHD